MTPIPLPHSIKEKLRPGTTAGASLLRRRLWNVSLAVTTQLFATRLAVYAVANA